MCPKPEISERRLLSLAQIAERWQVSRQTVRRVMQRHRVRPLYLGGDARNGSLRFDETDVNLVEARSQAGASSDSHDNPAKGFGDREERPA